MVVPELSVVVQEDGFTPAILGSCHGVGTAFTLKVDYASSCKADCLTTKERIKASRLNSYFIDIRTENVLGLFSSLCVLNQQHK